MFQRREEGRKEERSARCDEKSKKETKQRTLPEISLGNIVSGLPVIDEETSSKRRVADESDVELETRRERE